MKFLNIQEASKCQRIKRSATVMQSLFVVYDFENI